MVAHTLMVSGVVVALIGLIGGSSATPNTWDCDSRGRRHTATGLLRRNRGPLSHS
ncbi:hypothetical protein [Ralstonia phage phiRSL1]|uniref:Uncharacterized protein n=1 Tax=Ralstonia phage phiRSL1 TaxID=1980924 RepID=B2ZXM3_9CAUD|nr:hypothetical protein RSL1_ORF004 [Ralstonia phage phiRSL1]BAG41449.1 hypothetical protein [Ralstonia phage phiRSL1]